MLPPQLVARCSLEVLKFCFANNIILCRIPSYTSHKLHLCDVSVFGPLKAAYHDDVARLDRGEVGTVGKEHFTYLYKPARERALTSRSIRAGWTDAGLFPFDLDRVIKGLPKPLADVADKAANKVQQSDQATLPQIPVTPVSADAVTVLHNPIKKDANSLDGTMQQRLHRHIEKLINATHLSFAERAFLREQNQFLAKVNNETKVRRATRPEVVGKARVMGYGALEAARKERADKDAAKAEKKAKREAKKKANRTTTTKEVIFSKENLCKQGTHNTDDPDSVLACGELIVDSDIVPGTCRGPVARMW